MNPIQSPNAKVSYRKIKKLCKLNDMSAIGLTLAMQSYWAANISYLNGSISRNVLNTRSFNMENCLTFV
ncbi:hypothetical protein A3206_06700 [Candidatus Methanomassiliicoccus intestinalis]|nr:MAG: hypothetical protein A3206_06700 [Candidatus Methanomassiliicoccus intestinalis]